MNKIDVRHGDIIDYIGNDNKTHKAIFFETDTEVGLQGETASIYPLEKVEDIINNI